MGEQNHPKSKGQGEQYIYIQKLIKDAVQKQEAGLGKEAVQKMLEKGG